MVSVVPNGIKYLQYLSQLLNNSEIIQEPKIANNLVIIHKNKKKNKLLGWVILGKEVKFSKECYLDCDEIAESSGNYGKFIINRFSYHFSATGDLLEFRIDLQEGDLHAHPDDRTKLSSHLRPEKELQLDISNFNIILAIYLAILYIKEQRYPLFDENADYINRILEQIRRKLK